MIGPVPVGEADPFNDPFPVGGDRAAIVMWHERQRRQRQVRLMMMFMMMLLLMDGDEQGNARRRQYAARHGGRLRSGSRGGRGRGGGDDDDDDLMADHLYRARIAQDDRIGKSARLDPRYAALQRMNGGKDVEREVMDWVVEDMARREKEGAGQEEGADEANGADKATKGKRFFIYQTSPDADADAETDSREKDVEESNKRAVYHYPINGTGYYRGEWKRLGDDGDYDKNGTVSGKGGSGKSSVAIEKVEGGGETKTPKENDKDDGDEGSSSDNAYIVDEVEIEAAVQTMMRDRGDRIGVSLLPSGMRLPKAYNASANATLSPTEEAANAIERAYSRQKGSMDTGRRAPFLRPSMNADAGSTNKKKSNEEQKEEPKLLHLSKSSGRAAFQLYSRSIPAMTQLSLVVGFVKLHDGENTAFSTRRDLLMRVRGIVVHSIGKVSLVANAGRGRSVMVIRTDADRDTARSIIPTSTEPKEAKKERIHDNEKSDRRRRLQEIVADLSGQPNDFTLDEIRDDVLALFGDSKDLGEPRPLLRHMSEENPEEYELAFIHDLEDIYDGAGFSDGSFDNLFIGERCRQRAEAIYKLLTREPRHRNGSSSSLTWFIPHRITSFIQRWLGMEAANFPSDGVIPIDADDEVGRRRRRLSISEESVDFSARILTLNSSADGTLEADSNTNSVIGSEDDDVEEIEPAEYVNSTRLSLLNNASYVSTSASRRIKVNTDAAATKTETLTKRKNQKVAASTNRSSEEKRLKGAEMYAQMTKTIQTYPFVPDDEDHSIEKTVTPIDRRIPYREQLLEENGIQCEFQLNLEIKQTEWSVGEWRRFVKRQIYNVKGLDPASRRREEEMDSEENEAEARDPAAAIPRLEKKKKRATSARAATKSLQKKSASSASSSSSSMASAKEDKNSMVMTLTGVIVSTECHFNASINVTAIRTDWEHTTGKAINYSFYMMLTCLSKYAYVLCCNLFSIIVVI